VAVAVRPEPSVRISRGFNEGAGAAARRPVGSPGADHAEEVRPWLPLAWPSRGPTGCRHRRDRRVREGPRGGRGLTGRNDLSSFGRSGDRRDPGRTPRADLLEGGGKPEGRQGAEPGEAQQTGRGGPRMLPVHRLSSTTSTIAFRVSAPNGPAAPADARHRRKGLLWSGCWR